MQVPQIAYLSPTMRFDADAHTVVVEFRKADNGEVVRQIPTPTRLKDLRETVETPTPAPAPPTAPSSPVTPPVSASAIASQAVVSDAPSRALVAADPPVRPVLVSVQA